MVGTSSITTTGGGEGFREARPQTQPTSVEFQKGKSMIQEIEKTQLTPQCWPSDRKDQGPVKPSAPGLPVAEREERQSQSMDAAVAVARPSEEVQPELLAWTELIGQVLLLRVIEAFSSGFWTRVVCEALKVRVGEESKDER